MPLFEQTIPVKHEKVAEIVQKYWNLELGQLIKASQNHTFSAQNKETGEKYSIRVTPNPNNIHMQRITDELFFVNFISSQKVYHICKPIEIEGSQNFIINQDEMIVVVFEWAKGAQIDFMSFRWMLDDSVVKAHGKIFAQIHNSSRLFSKQYPEIAKRIQRWDQIHHGILANTKLHQDDIDKIQDQNYFGVLHGDLNCSNFYYIDESNNLSVFDWDQVQQGFYLWDLSQAIFTIVMLAEAGLPVAGTPVPEANPEQFTKMIVEGYESEIQTGKINLDQLNRMIELKREFYRLFCQRAEEEGNIPADMAPFILYINNWFNSKKKE